MIGTEFEVWVCPKCKGCTAMPCIQGVDLSREWNTDLKFRPTYTRDICQICNVPRVRHIAVVSRQWELSRPQMTEAEYFRYMEEQRRRASDRNKDVPI